MGFAAAPSEATQFADAVRATPLVNSGRSLIALTNMVRPLLAKRALHALARFRQGQAVPLTSVSYRSTEDRSTPDVAVFDESNALGAVAFIDESGLMLRPKKVFAG